MIQIIKKWFYRLTGGRPMDLLEYAFWDPFSGCAVWYFRDRLNGDVWMADSGPWSSFRVKKDTDQDMVEVSDHAFI